MNPISLSYNSMFCDTNLHDLPCKSLSCEVKGAKITIVEAAKILFKKTDSDFNSEDQPFLLQRFIGERDGGCRPLLSEPEDTIHVGETVNGILEPPAMSSVRKVFFQGLSLSLALAGSLILEPAARNDTSNTLHDMANSGGDYFEVTGNNLIDEEAESSGNESEID